MDAVNKELEQLAKELNDAWEKLAISENLIKSNVEFSKLRFPSLKRINIDGNPYFDESGANPKIEVLIQLVTFPTFCVPTIPPT